MIPRWVIFQIITLPEKLRLLLSEISVANLVANFIIAATEKKYQNTEEINKNTVADCADAQICPNIRCISSFYLKEAFLCDFGPLEPYLI